MATRGAVAASSAAPHACRSACRQPQAPPRAAPAPSARARHAPRAACARGWSAAFAQHSAAAVACAVPGFACAAASDDAGDAETREWQSLLAALRACTPDALQPLVSSRRAAVSTRFMLWLAGEAAAAEARGDADASALETLCGLVFVAREGLEDGRAVLAQLGSTDPCALPAAAPAALTQQGADARFEDFAALAQQLKPGSAGLEAELSKRWAALALRGEQEAPGQAGLNSASRRSSAAEIMGRAALDGAQPDEVLRPQAEERILAALLAIEDDAERLAAVDDALTPPEAGAADNDDDGEGDELLFTTPLRLLRAIDLSLQRLERGAPHLSASLQLAGGGVADAAGALAQLRAAVVLRV